MFTQDANFKSIIFWKVQKYTTKWALFVLLCLGRYGDILGQNHKILLKNHWKLGKLYNYFIIICILNPKESFYNKCHRLSLCLKNDLFIVLIILGQNEQIFCRIMWSYKISSFVKFLHAQAIYRNAFSK
jgi:hypothetical protein